VNGTTEARELGAFSRVDETDADDFIERLDKMHTLDAFRAYKRQSFAALRIGEGSLVAEIGSGTGEDAARLARLMPSGRMIGLDLSEAMVAEASRRYSGIPNLEFRQASADALPFESGTLDAIRADRVLIHVPDAQAVLDEMVRVLKPGGRLVVSEPDMSGCWVSTSHPAASAAIARAIAGSCLHPFLPRDIGVMLRDMKLEEVEHDAVALVSSDFETINHACQFGLVVEGVKKAGLMPAEEMDAWWTEQQQRVRDGRFCAGLSVMTASATKPAGERSVFFT